MVRGMLRSCFYFQIGNLIVFLVLILVMNVLISFQQPTDFILHQDTMKRV